MKRTKNNQRAVVTDFLLLLGAAGALLLVAAVILRLFGIHPIPEEARRIEYTLEIEGEEIGTRDYIHEGDRVIDRTNRKLLGTVKSVEASDYLKEAYNESAGRLVMRRIPGKENVRIVIVADSGAPYTVAGKAISIGTSLTFRTRDFAGTGTVVEIRA